MAFLDSLREFINANSQYDPATWEGTKTQDLDGPVDEPDIPATQPDFRLPREEAIYHPDFMAPKDTPQHKVVTENAYEPGGELPAAKPKPQANFANPDWGVDAPANQLGTGQYSLTTQAARIVEPSLFRIEITILNLSSTATVYLGSTPAAATATSGLPLAPNQSVSMAYNDVLYASASANGAVVCVADLVRN